MYIDIRGLASAILAFARSPGRTPSSVCVRRRASLSCKPVRDGGGGGECKHFAKLKIEIAPPQGPRSQTSAAGRQKSIRPRFFCTVFDHTAWCFKIPAYTGLETGGWCLKVSELTSLPQHKDLTAVAGRELFQSKQREIHAYVYMKYVRLSKHLMFSFEPVALPKLISNYHLTVVSPPPSPLTRGLPSEVVS